MIENPHEDAYDNDQIATAIWATVRNRPGIAIINPDDASKKLMAMMAPLMARPTEIIPHRAGVAPRKLEDVRQKRILRRFGALTDVPNLCLFFEDSDRRKLGTFDRSIQTVRLMLFRLDGLFKFDSFLLSTVVFKRWNLDRCEAIRALDAATGKLCIWSHSRVTDFAVRGDVALLFLLRRLPARRLQSRKFEAADAADGDGEPAQTEVDAAQAGVDVASRAKGEKAAPGIGAIHVLRGHRSQEHSSPCCSDRGRLVVVNEQAAVASVVVLAVVVVASSICCLRWMCLARVGDGPVAGTNRGRDGWFHHIWVAVLVGFPKRCGNRWRERKHLLDEAGVQFVW